MENNNNLGQVKISNDVIVTIAGLAALEVEGVETITSLTDKLLKNNGVKIQIEEVESALKPFLKAPFAITKAPDEKFGEEVVLVTEADDMSEIQEICVNALPRYWQPRRYLHVDSIPMTETGKPARQQIEQIARG